MGPEKEKGEDIYHAGRVCREEMPEKSMQDREAWPPHEEAGRVQPAHGLVGQPSGSRAAWDLYIKNIAITDLRIIDNINLVTWNRGRPSGYCEQCSGNTTLSLL